MIALVSVVVELSILYRNRPCLATADCEFNVSFSQQDGIVRDSQFIADECAAADDLESFKTERIEREQWAERIFFNFAADIINLKMNDMKRAKNKVYCVSCKREKLLFETQEAADRYIKFFREEKEGMNAKIASRSYYCVFCGGYHLTSVTDKSKTRWFENKNSWMIRKIDDIIKSKEDITPVIENVKNKISNEVEQLIVQGLSHQLVGYRCPRSCG